MSRYGILRSKEFKEHLNQRRYEREVEERLEEERIQEQNRQRQISEKIEKEKRKLQETFESLKSDWRSELFPQEEQFEPVEIIEEIKVIVPEKLKSNWRKELNEGMTTSGGEIQLAPTDVPLDTLDAANAASFTASVGGFDPQAPQDGLSGAQIVPNGTGSGSNGGFNLGRSYLSFNGVGFDDTGASSPEFDNKRHVILTPVDTSRATTIEISAIVGNGSNGGEAPSVNQDLQLWYTDASEPNTITAALDDTGNFITVVPYNGSGSLRTYSVTLPSNEFNNLRRQGIQFVLFQDQGINPTTTNDNYGITQIKVKRTTPISVIAPLDTPEAVSFMRVGTGPNMETPEQRYRRITQQLLASKKYTTTKFGSNYPGSNFSGLKGVSASPIGKQASYDTWSRASERNAAQASSTFTDVETDYQPGITFTTQYADPSDTGPYKVSVAGPTNVGAALPRQSVGVGGWIAAAMSPARIAADEIFKTDQKNAEISRIEKEIELRIAHRSHMDKTFKDIVARGGPDFRHKVGDMDRQISNLQNQLKSLKSQPVPSPQNLLTPQQLANIDKQIKDLQRQSEKNKQDAVNNQWRAVGELAMGALQAAALLSPIPGDEAIVAGALAVKTGAGSAGARAFAKANPGKYNPFLSDRVNRYFRNSYEPQRQLDNTPPRSKMNYPPIDQPSPGTNIELQKAAERLYKKMGLKGS